MITIHLVDGLVIGRDEGSLVPQLTVQGVNLAGESDRGEEEEIRDVLSDKSGSCMSRVKRMPDQPQTGVLVPPIGGNLGNIRGRSRFFSSIINYDQGLMIPFLQLFQLETGTLPHQHLHSLLCQTLLHLFVLGLILVVVEDYRLWDWVKTCLRGLEDPHHQLGLARHGCAYEEGVVWKLESKIEVLLQQRIHSS